MPVIQRVLLVGLAKTSKERWAKADQLEELAALTWTAGGRVVEKLVQVRARPDPATLAGKGMVERLAALCRQHDIELVIMDDELTPTQQRNLEQATGVRVIDRAALILDIFALHARTAESKIQVELAQLEYRQSRLTGFGIELSRLGGGIGTRGPGETKLEVDRRRIRERIATLKKELLRIDRERLTQRRRRSSEFQVVLVGYTNAGKSTLFNRLTRAEVLVSDRLFATLDPNTKTLDLARRLRVVLTDTVGFIRHLPHQLVASFRSTLSEVREADLLLHVVSAVDPDYQDQMDAVTETLEEVGARDKPVLVVFSKMDRVFDETERERLARAYPGSVFVSGKTGAGVSALLGAIRQAVEVRMTTVTFELPAARGDLAALAQCAGEVLTDVTERGRRRITVLGFESALGRVEKELAQRAR